MNGRIVMPATKHYCNPGWELRDSEDMSAEAAFASMGGPPLPADHVPEPGRYMHDLQLPEGAVVICECGKSWVGYRPYINVASNSWRREGRIARWRRERREAKK